MECIGSAGSVWHVRVLRYEILLWQTWIVFYVEGCRVSSAEWHVYLVGVDRNRLSACREFCGVYSWQNGTRCRDGVKVLQCCSRLAVLRIP